MQNYRLVNKSYRVGVEKKNPLSSSLIQSRSYFFWRLMHGPLMPQRKALILLSRYPYATHFLILLSSLHTLCFAFSSALITYLFAVFFSIKKSFYYVVHVTHSPVSSVFAHSNLKYNNQHGPNGCCQTDLYILDGIILKDWIHFDDSVNQFLILII